MKPIRTPDMSDTLVGPQGSDIFPLPALVDRGTTSSVWELDELERAQLAEGGHIGLIVLAFPPPPVDLKVSAPPGMEWNERLGTYVCAENEED